MHVACLLAYLSLLQKRQSAEVCFSVSFLCHQKSEGLLTAYLNISPVSTIQISITSVISCKLQSTINTTQCIMKLLLSTTSAFKCVHQRFHTRNYFANHLLNRLVVSVPAPALLGSEQTSPTAFRTFSSTTSRDPSARRPNKICDPYGQHGKPLSNSDASNQLSLLEVGWSLDYPETKTEDSNQDGNPSALMKEYYHENYMDASRFASIVAAVAHINNHYPMITIERRLMKREKAWRVVTSIKCRTETLGGLSFNDFHIAMLIDVEAGREDARKLFLEEKDSLKKHI